MKAQESFEKGLLEKTAKQTGDIILYDSHIVLYKMESDVMMYVVGSLEENEVLLYNVMLAMRDSLHLLFKYVCAPSLCSVCGIRQTTGRLVTNFSPFFSPSPGRRSTGAPSSRTTI